MTSARSSLAAIKARLFPRMHTGFLFLQQPFFEVDVQLSIPVVRLSPSLDDVQRSVNRIAAAVLHAYAHVWEWGQLGVPDPVVSHSVHAPAFTLVSPAVRTPRVAGSATGTPVARALFSPARAHDSAGGGDMTRRSERSGATGEHPPKVSFFTRIGQDLEIVKTCLLLAGALHGARNTVSEYLASFRVYEWLWRDDMDGAFKRFLATNPSIEVTVVLLPSVLLLLSRVGIRAHRRTLTAS